MDTTMNLYRAFDFETGFTARRGDSGAAGKLKRLERDYAELLEERDRLREQLDHIRELADRVMTVAEERETRIFALEAQLAAKDRLLADFEAENDALIVQVSQREDRIDMLQRFLNTIAEAEERAPGLVP